MMETKQQILKAIEELPDDAGVEEAMDRLYLLYKNERGLRQADGSEPISHRSREIEWRRTHRKELREYEGQWIVLEGGEIISHGDSPADVVRDARARGIRVPYVFLVEDVPENTATLGL
jgi:hypothetical protein